MAHKLPPLRFGYDALEPYIDAETMELHHDKHHAAYVDNLNKALEPYPHLAELTVEDLLRRLDQVPEAIRTDGPEQRRGPRQPSALLGHPWAAREWIAEGRDWRRHQEGLRLVRALSVSLHRRGHDTLRRGMGVPRHERLAAAPGDRVAAQPGQRAGARDSGAPLLRCLGARVLPEIPEPPRGLPQRLVEGRRLGCGRRTATRCHGRTVRTVDGAPCEPCGAGTPRIAMRRSARTPSIDDQWPHDASPIHAAVCSSAGRPPG